MTLLEQLDTAFNSGQIAHRSGGARMEIMATSLPITVHRQDLLLQWNGADALTAYRLSADWVSQLKRVYWDYDTVYYLPQNVQSPIIPLVGWRGEPDYASIARHGNYVYCGVATPPQVWTEEFGLVFREIALALASH